MLFSRERRVNKKIIIDPPRNLTLPINSSLESKLQSFSHTPRCKPMFWDTDWFSSFKSPQLARTSKRLRAARLRLRPWGDEPQTAELFFSSASLFETNRPEPKCIQTHRRGRTCSLDLWWVPVTFTWIKASPLQQARLYQYPKLAAWLSCPARVV